MMMTMRFVIAMTVVVRPVAVVVSRMALALPIRMAVAVSMAMVVIVSSSTVMVVRMSMPMIMVVRCTSMADLRLQRSALLESNDLNCEFQLFLHSLPTGRS
jgi:hypothetical protein